jgi:hypothetical protein
MVFYSRVFSEDLNTTPFNITSNGRINFTPSNDDVGNFTFLIRGEDNSPCRNNYTSDYYSLEIKNVNDAPYLVKDIPSQSFTDNEVLHAFFLDQYFEDPDQDSLTYTLTGNQEIDVVINPSTSEVVISSDSCDTTENVVFSAFDPYGEVANSNLVSIKCIQVTQSQETTPSSSSSGGGSGGGSARLCREPEYECFEYHKCNASNVKIDRCVDAKGCEEDVFLTLPCNYDPRSDCQENWICEDWQSCSPNGTQIRDCYDNNTCGTFNLLPEIVRACDYVGTCEDGIKNCHDGVCEEAIDCGGPCMACKEVQVPFAFEQKGNFGLYVLTGMILIVMTSVLLYHYYHTEINEAFAKAGWLLRRKRKKQILLSLTQKRELLNQLLSLEKDVFKNKLGVFGGKLSDVLRKYFVTICHEDIEMDFNLVSLEEKLYKGKQRKIYSELKNYYLSLFEDFEKAFKNPFKPLQALFFIEETRNMILQTSASEKEDHVREVKELKTLASDNYDSIMKKKIINTLIALEFLEIEVSKKKYLDITSTYSKLSATQQEEVYSAISRLYNMISYVNSWNQEEE